jgi:oligopeptide transport system substrate-binding protein
MRQLTAGFSIAIAAVALAACGSGGTSGPSGASRQIGGASGTELAAEQVLHWGNGAEPQSLDPHKSEGIPSSRIQRNLFEGLITEAADGALLPGAAESWEISEDGKVYIFKMRENGRWSNGDPVTAHDFVYSIRRSLDPKTLSRYQFILYPIANAEQVASGALPVESTGIEALDDYTLEITLESSTPYFLGQLAHSSAYPVHRATVEQFGDRFARPGNLISNGAYMLEDWVIQSYVELQRNPYYWNNDETVIETVFMYNTEDMSAEVKRYRADGEDISYSDLPASQLPWLRENLPDELHIAPYLGSYYYGLNLTQPPFSEHGVDLRRALALAVNRQIITEEISAAGQIPAFGFVPPVDNYTGQQMPEADWTQAEREDEARRLYAAAGFSRENPLRIEVMYNTHEDHRRVALGIAAMWKQVLGVEASILNQEWKVFLDTRNAMRETQVFRQGWIGDYNDANTFLELYQSTSGLNDTGFKNPEYDRLLKLAAAENDLQKRGVHLQAAERILLEEMPIVPLYFYVTTTLVKPWVRGFQPNIMDRHRAQYFSILEH